MENFLPGFATSAGMDKQQTIQWLTEATSAARAALGPDGIIAQSPYYSPNAFASGYLDLYLQTPRPSVDAFLIQ
jgi:hypothetical protein